LSCAALISLSLPSISYAEVTEEPSHVSKERVDNYERPVFENSEQASTEMTLKIKDINEILGKDGGIEFIDLETIHEKTSAMEAAVDKFRADKAYDEAKINVLDEAVQALHYASENQDLPKTHDWFLKVNTAFEGLSKATLVTEAPKQESKDIYELFIKDHKFSPAALKLPADQKIKLIVDNQDPTPEEFESHDLNREKIIAGNTKATILIGPLKPGKYHFFGEFNMDTAKGDIIVE
jgi:Cupredoxin-like domain